MRLLALFTLTILVGVQLLQGCFATVVHHEPKDAIKVAESFARKAFVEKDLDGALVYVGKEKETLKPGALASAIEQIHGTVPFPENIAATDYEIPFGQRKVVVYLEGSRDGRSSYYRIGTIGDSTTNYTVSDLDRADVPFPKSSLNQPIR